MSTLILDNGAFKIKFGFDNEQSPRGSSSNCVAQVRKQMLVYTGDQLDANVNGSLLQYTRYINLHFSV